MDAFELKNRFEYHPPENKLTVVNHQIVRDACLDAADAINQVCPEGGEKLLAMTKLEEVMFWANAAIARNHQ